jgi:hypothetical protein
MYFAVVLLFLMTFETSAAPKQNVQMEVEIWKNGVLDSTAHITALDGDHATISQSTDALSFKLSLSPKTTGYSDRAYKIAVAYSEIKHGEVQDPLLAQVETSSYETSIVRFLPPTDGADPIELKISAKPVDGRAPSNK